MRRVIICVLLVFFLALGLQAKEPPPRDIESFRKIGSMTTCAEMIAAFGKPDRETSGGYIYSLSDNSEIKVSTGYSENLMVVSWKNPKTNEEEILQSFLVDPNVATRELKRFKAIIPPEWKLAEAKDKKVPYGFKKEGVLGTHLTFTGPKEVEVHIGNTVQQHKESFSLWIMPANYVPVSSPMFQFGDADRLGSNSEMLVFENQFFTGETPSWPKWKSDIIQFLNLTSPSS